MERQLRCYYEVLDIERLATSEDIRRAYKKKSLQYHPDKNYNNQEEAAVMFKEVQNAYSILIDPDERAWYDSHREAILRGDNGNVDPEGVNLYDYFSARCYEGFGDDEGGFFAVYRGVFDSLIEEESEFSAKAKGWPAFGDSSTEWPEIQTFYNHWKNFNSVKTFAWKDEYKVNEMEDRYSRRMADRINQKARSSAKKEYVDTVRSFAQFVYKRDPRVERELARQKEENEEKLRVREEQDRERQKRRAAAKKKVWEEAAEEEARQEAERRARGEAVDECTIELQYEKDRAAREMMQKGQRPASMAGFAMLDNDEASASSQSFNCPACKKKFTNDKQFTEHVNSNKHKTKLKQLAAKGIDVNELMGETAAAEEEEEDN